MCAAATDLDLLLEDVDLVLLLQKLLLLSGDLSTKRWGESEIRVNEWRRATSGEETRPQAVLLETHYSPLHATSQGD